MPLAVRTNFLMFSTSISIQYRHVIILSTKITSSKNFQDSRIFFNFFRTKKRDVCSHDHVSLWKMKFLTKSFLQFFSLYENKNVIFVQFATHVKKKSASPSYLKKASLFLLCFLLNETLISFQHHIKSEFFEISWWVT